MKAVLSRLSLLIVAMTMLFASCEKESGSETNQPEGGNNNPELAGNTINGHEYVDLGLPSGLKWATCNIGATNPEDFGNYYAWGETSTKSEYVGSNCSTNGVNLSDISGNAQHDAARANWGSTWRLPTIDELKELKNNCTLEWTWQGINHGYKITGPNGNSIFLPAGGYYNESSVFSKNEIGQYWTSSPYENNLQYAMRFSFGKEVSNIEISEYYRYMGYSVRPVSN